MFKGYTFPQFHCVYVFSMVVKINFHIGKKSISKVVKINFPRWKNQFPWWINKFARW